MKNTFQHPFWKKIRKLQIRPSVTVVVAVGLKSSAFGPTLLIYLPPFM